MTEHIVAIFESEIAADMAARDLMEAGVPQSAIRRYRPDGLSGGDITHSTVDRTQETGGGFWSWLLGEEDGVAAQRARYPDDHDVYERGARAGNAVVSVTLTDSAQAEQAATVLESHHPLQLDQEDDQDTSGGASRTMGRDTGAAAGLSAGPDYLRTSVAATPGIAAETGQTIARGDNGTEQVIPLKEEDVRIGKRMVDHGTTRVRRYVVDTPVEKEVALHGERVTIERRRPVGATNGGAFEERTIEVRETEEVPVVEKTARVVEEVAIRKEATERKETVRDTVRREEVEVTPADGARIDANARTR